MKTKSTKYPKEIKILGNKVYVRDLESVVETTDEEDNIIYEFDEEKLSKDEYIEMLKKENKELEGVVDDLTQVLIDKGVIH